MSLPNSLQQVIQEQVEKVSLATLIKAQEALTSTYRNQKNGQRIQTEVEYLVYLTTRMPATYAAIQYVMQEIKKRLPLLSPASLLDLGAGPGTVLWAALPFFQLQTAQLLEKDAHMRKWGEKLGIALTAKQNFMWLSDDFVKTSVFEPADLVTISYALGEISEEERLSVITNAWNAATQVLVIIEPGTPAGFACIRAMREKLIALGAHIVAPCCGSYTCPMEKQDWCHFSVRLDRSPHHRLLKNGELNYEDEKFSYLVASKSTSLQTNARILQHPQIRSGHVNLTVCTQDGLRKQVISRRDQELYKRARKWEWGDTY